MKSSNVTNDGPRMTLAKVSMVMMNPPLPSRHVEVPNILTLGAARKAQKSVSAHEEIDPFHAVHPLLCRRSLVSNSPASLLVGPFRPVLISNRWEGIIVLLGDVDTQSKVHDGENVRYCDKGTGLQGAGTDGDRPG